MSAVNIAASGQIFEPNGKDSMQEEIARQREYLRQSGPGLRMPTPQWLASLPTDTGELLKLLRLETGDHEKWTVDHLLWDAMAQLYSSCELLLTPTIRAALLRSFTGLSGLSVRHVSIDGQQLVAIRQTDGKNGNEIIFDPQTGRAVGRGNSYSGDDLTVVQPPTGPTLDPGVLYQATWVQTIVDEI
jgi:hypothetical protein